MSASSLEVGSEKLQHIHYSSRMKADSHSKKKGGTGIGLMIAQALAANGAKVYIASRRGEVLKTSSQVCETSGGLQRLADMFFSSAHYSRFVTLNMHRRHGRQAHGGEKVAGEIIPLEMDQNDKASIEEAFEAFKQKESKLDLLVNNAGLASNKVDVAIGDKDVEAFSKELFQDDVSNWNDVYTTNVYGYYYVSAKFIPLLVKANKPDRLHKNSKDFAPNIINICSISGITKTTQHGQFAYNSSKAATIQLTKLLATEFSRENISVRVKYVGGGVSCRGTECFLSQ